MSRLIDLSLVKGVSGVRADSTLQLCIGNQYHMVSGDPSNGLNGLDESGRNFPDLGRTNFLERRSSLLLQDHHS
jgi:hypothetical protein